MEFYFRTFELKIFNDIKDFYCSIRYALVNMWVSLVRFNILHRGSQDSRLVKFLEDKSPICSITMCRMVKTHPQTECVFVWPMFILIIILLWFTIGLCIVSKEAIQKWILIFSVPFPFTICKR